MTFRRACWLSLSVLIGLPLFYGLSTVAVVAWRVHQVSPTSEQAALALGVDHTGALAAAPAAGLVQANPVATAGATDAGALAASGAYRTRYPVVLVHGMMGFESVFGMSYWYDLVPRLKAHGVEVFTPAVSSFNDSELRGAQLLPQVEAIARAQGGKVHLIGHSQGSQTARYVAAKRPDLVASVTAIAGPNKGSEVADWLVAAQTEHPMLSSVVLGLGQWLGGRINAMAGTELPIDIHATLQALSTPGATAFNQRYPAAVPATACGEGEHVVNGIPYFSFTGVAQVGRWYSLADQVMALTSLAFKQDPDNDGLVGRCASHLGQVVRDDLPLNHFHVVRQLFGFTPDTVDVGEIYLSHIQRLKVAGG
jgi:triacylglycerol lipase